jgi:hypothetical protein
MHSVMAHVWRHSVRIPGQKLVLRSVRIPDPTAKERPQFAVSYTACHARCHARPVGGHEFLLYCNVFFNIVRIV